MKEYNLPRIAVACGSDLRAVSPREMLGVFVGFRARHMRDTGRWQEAQSDYLMARWLFPNSRRLYIDSMTLTVRYGDFLFDAGEVGSAQSLAEDIVAEYGQPGAGYPVGDASGWCTTFISR